LLWLSVAHPAPSPESELHVAVDDNQWMADQQRRHNLSTFKWPAPKPRPRRYRFTDRQMVIALRSLQKKEQKSNGK